MMRSIDLVMIGVASVTMACGGSAFSPSTTAEAGLADQSSSQLPDVTSPDMNLSDAGSDAIAPPDPRPIDAAVVDAPSEGGFDLPLPDPQRCPHRLLAYGHRERFDCPRRVGPQE